MAEQQVAKQLVDDQQVALPVSLLTLPAEMLNEVLAYLRVPDGESPSQDLLQLSSTCRYLRKVIEPMLYDSIYVHESGFAQTLPLVWTLLKRPELFDHIQTLQCACTSSPRAQYVKLGDEPAVLFVPHSGLATGSKRKGFIQSFLKERPDFIPMFRASLAGSLPQSGIRKAFANITERIDSWPTIVALVLKARNLKSIKISGEHFRSQVFQEGAVLNYTAGRALQMLRDLEVSSSMLKNEQVSTHADLRPAHRESYFSLDPAAWENVNLTFWLQMRSLRKFDFAFPVERHAVTLYNQIQELRDDGSTVQDLNISRTPEMGMQNLGILLGRLPKLKSFAHHFRLAKLPKGQTFDCRRFIEMLSDKQHLVKLRITARISADEKRILPSHQTLALLQPLHLSPLAHLKDVHISCGLLLGSRFVFDDLEIEAAFHARITGIQFQAPEETVESIIYREKTAEGVAKHLPASLERFMVCDIEWRQALLTVLGIFNHVLIQRETAFPNIQCALIEWYASRHQAEARLFLDGDLVRNARASGFWVGLKREYDEAVRRGCLT